MENVSIYENSNIKIYINANQTLLFFEIIDGTYNQKKFLEAIEYYENFWLLVNNSEDKYYQIFIFNDVKSYPLFFYNEIYKTLKKLENIFKKNLFSSCLINKSNAIDILKPLLNMYKSVKPFKFVKTLEDGYNFLFNNI